MLKAFTLHEPFAYLMTISAKTNETRGTRTSIRGEVAIHAAKTMPMMSDALALALNRARASRGIVGQFPRDTLGCILCVVEIVDVMPSEHFAHPLHPPSRPPYIAVGSEELQFGNYEPGRFIFRTKNLRVLRKPVPARGSQALGWTVPPDVEAEVRRQL